MTRKKDFPVWTWDNYHKLFVEFYDVPPSDLRAYIEDLKGLLDSVARVFSFRSPPAELVFATLKEVLLYAKHFFSGEHTDILRRNPNIRVVYEPTMFHGIEGTTEIDTGLPTNRGERFPSQPRNEPFLEEYFGDLLQEVIELQKAYFKKKPFFFEKYYDFLIERAKETVPKPGSPTSVEQFSEIKSLRRQAAYWQRRYHSVARKRPSKKSTKNHAK